MASTYAYHFIIENLVGRYGKYVDQSVLPTEQRRDNHILSAGVKALASWHQVSTLQTCREACGGMGLKASSMIGIMRAEDDVQVTYEGDNTVLLLSISRPIFHLLQTDKNNFETSLSNSYPVTLDKVNDEWTICRHSFSLVVL